jgi:phosphoglycerate kinase
MMIPKLKDIDVRDKRVLVRVDFNVPLDAEQTITDDTRIVSSLDTIKYLLEQNARVILVSHLGRPKGQKSPKYSLAPCARRLEKLLGSKVIMAPDVIGDTVDALAKNLKPKECLLLENVRFYQAEEKPDLDPSFAEKLAELADVYVNDAFGTAHRAHSSTTQIAKFFPGKKACGFLLEKEIAFLGQSLEHPKRPFFAIIGGAKISTKLGVLHALVEKADVVMLGGAMAYTFLQAKGIPIGNSLCEVDMLDTAKEILKKGGNKIQLPLDVVAATHFANDTEFQVFDTKQGIKNGFQGMDIGPKTIASWQNMLQEAKTVLWNGPVGVFEFQNFAKGTLAIAETLAALQDASTIVGGGDSVAAVEQAKLSAKMTHISTGGGASLEYVEHGTLPGIEALR